jgi:hypothetical protein
MANNVGGFQMFEFRFCNLKFFWIQATGLCENWGMTACVNVMFHPMGWGGHHITCAQNGGKFLKQMLHVIRDRIRDFLCCRWKRNKRLNNGRNVGQRHFGGGWPPVQANSTWLVSGATVILNFLKKSMPRMGLATVA